MLLLIEEDPHYYDLPSPQLYCTNCTRWARKPLVIRRSWSSPLTPSRQYFPDNLVNPDISINKHAPGKVEEYTPILVDARATKLQLFTSF